MLYRTVFIILILSTFACSNEVSKSLEPRSTALGKMNEIVVIADDEIWESPAGDTFRYYFESAYPIMPTPEPYFDLRHFTAEELRSEPLRRELRSYAFLADLSDENSLTTNLLKQDFGSEKFNAALEKKKPGNSVGMDKWAKGQLLLYMYGTDNKTLAEAIKTSFPAVASRVNKHDEKQLNASVYAVERTNLGLSSKVLERYGVSLEIPGLYKEALYDEENDFTWLRREDHEATLCIMIKKIPYTSVDQLDKENLIAVRNEMGKRYVTSDTEGDVMEVNNKDLPVYEYKRTLDGFYMKEIRGVWEMSLDFFGGPFASYALVKDQDKEIIFIDVFVYAPGKEKRTYMQQLDYIIKNAKVLGTRPTE